MLKRMIGGIFLLLSCVMGIILAAAMQIGWGIAGFDPTGTFETMLLVCTALVVVFSLLALLGGISAFTGKGYGLALMGGIFGIFTIGYAFLGSVFGLIGLIFVLLAKEEFVGHEPAPVPAYGVPPPGYPPMAPPPGYPQQMPPPGYPPQQQAPPPGYPPQQQAPPPGYPPQQQAPPPGYPPQQQAPPPAQPPVAPSPEPIDEPPVEVDVPDEPPAEASEEPPKEE